MIIIKTPEEMEKMKLVGKITSSVCDEVVRTVKEGRTTGELDKVACNAIKKHGAESAFLNFNGYPGNICTSVNEAVVHGIPGDYVLKNGDIVSIDIGVVFGGFCGDMAVTVPVGTVSARAKKLIEVTKRALDAGIKEMVCGNRLYDISASIQELVEKNGFSVVRALVGHRIGRSLHEDPQIPNYGKRSTGPLLERGMVFALEPMVNAGDYRVKLMPDNWTVVSADGSLSGHFEHTVAITEKGWEILTVS